MHVDTRGGFGLAVMGLLRSNLAPMLAARSGGRTSAPPANGRDIVCQYRRADLRCGMANPPTKYARMMARSLLPHHEMGMFRISSTRAPSLHPHAKRGHDLRDVMGLCGGFEGRNVVIVKPFLYRQAPRPDALPPSDIIA